MKDYASMSDFEINEAVGKFVYLPHLCVSNGLCLYAKDDIWTEFDPCNNPADAWPIIVSKKICTAFDVFAEPNDGGSWVASPAYYVEGERIRHDNPLRAAMIVFLMMKEGGL